MQRKPTMGQKIIVWAVLLLFVLSGAKLYWDSLLSPVNPKDIQTKVFVISEGEKTEEISQRLQSEGLIKSAVAFNIFIQRSGEAKDIQAGDFKLSPSMSAEEILKQLTSGTVDKWVTLLEGWRVEEMAQRLHQGLGIDQDEFIKQVKEGYMFPDTYLFNPDVKVTGIVYTLKSNFNRKYDVSLQSKIRKLGLTADEGVILASIVEREARSDKARTMVASILLKRLKIGMALNTDATIQYALGYQKSEHSWWKRNLTKEDLKIDSPYNTYLHAGLPPTPICNPSLSSLQAVANADPDTPYLYYYHDSQGNSHYAKTLQEHNQNVVDYP